jgi:multimeric flavodoxin WrbA
VTRATGSPGTQTQPQGVTRPEAIRKVVLVVGSAKPRGTSSSESLGRALLATMGRQGARTAMLHAHHVSGDMREVIDLLDGCDLLVLASPLYFDALPSQVVTLLQRIGAWRRELVTAPAMSFAAMLNCGTPDAHQADAAIAMCGLAAREALLHWCGGMAFGEGDAIGGREPATLGTDRVTGAIEIAASGLLQGSAIPLAAQKLAATPMIPEGRYALLRNASWLVLAQRIKALLRIADRPEAP